MGSSPTVRTSYLAGAAGLSELAGQAAGLAHPVALPEPTAQALDRCRQRAIEVEAGQVGEGDHPGLAELVGDLGPDADDVDQLLALPGGGRHEVGCRVWLQLVAQVDHPGLVSGQARGDEPHRQLGRRIGVGQVGVRTRSAGLPHCGTDAADEVVAG